MLESLTLKGFRGHQERKLEKLARVNLLVGLNNAGKTAVLDAVELLLRDGHPRTLGWLAARRAGELNSGDGEILPDSLKYLFFGYGFKDCAEFELSSQGNPTRILKVVWENNADVSDYEPFPDEATITITRNGHTFEKLSNRMRLANPQTVQRSPERVQFVRPFETTASLLEPIWNSIVGNAEEDEVVKTMQLLDKRIERIVFSSDPGPDSNTKIFVRLSGHRDRIPMSSLGDGVFRILGIALRAVKARNGTLLLDEIDSGLHYSTMTTLWRWLCTYAATSNTQIFATTHNSDCINALGWLHKSKPELTESVAAFRIDPNEVNAIRYSASELEIVAEQGLEVRA